MDKHQMRDPFADWQIKENKVPEGVPAEGAANRVPEEAPAEKKTGGKKSYKKESGKEPQENRTDEVHKKTWAPYIATLLIIIMFSVLVYAVLYYLTLNSIAVDMKDTLEKVADCYQGGQEQWEGYEEEADIEYERLVSAISTNINKDKGKDKKYLVEKYREPRFFRNLLIVNKNGDIEASANPTNLDFHKDQSPELYQLLQIDDKTYPDVYAPTGIDGTNQGMPRYYPHLLEDGSVLVAEVQCNILDQIAVHRSSWEAQMDLAATRMDGFLMVVSTKTWNVIYGSKKAEAFRKAKKRDYRQLWSSPELGISTVDGVNYYTVFHSYNDDIVLVAVVPQRKLRTHVFQTVLALEIIFILMVFIMLIYAVYASNDQRKGSTAGWKKIHKRYYNKEIGKRLILCAILGMLAVGMMTFYVQTLISVTGTAKNTEKNLGSTLKALEDSESDVVNARKFVNSIRREFCSIYLENAGFFESLNKETLSLAELDIMADSINIYNMNGENVLHSAYSLEFDKEKKKKKIYDVSLAMWTEDYYLGKPEEIYDGYKYQEIAKIIKDQKGQEYLVVITVRACDLPESLDDQTLNETLEKVMLSNGGFAFSVDKESKMFSYYPEQELIGQNIRNYGLDENKLRNDYTGDMEIAGDKYIVSIAEKEKDMIGVAIDRSQALLGRLPVTLLSAGASLLCLLILWWLLAFRGENVTGVAEPAFMKKINKGRSAEAMTIRIIRNLMMILGVLISLVALFRNYLFPKESLLLYALDGSWTEGLNIFSLTVSIVNVAEGMLVILFVRKLLELLEDTFSTRGATICRLCSGLIKYLGVILIIYKCVANFGVNTGTLLTSAGILGTVVGLGANSLLADIFAGLFIIFEGDLQVSDMVEFGDFVGFIEEIGIRTTKIQNVDHNTKILNNKDITKIIDRARKYNYCHVYVTVNHKESLERIEAMLARELPAFKEKFPFLIGEPEYRGISSLTDGGMTLDIRFKAHPRYIIEVGYEMNREIQKLFTAYDIELNIPYVMNQLNKEALPGTDQDAEQADAYLKKRWIKRRR